MDARPGMGLSYSADGTLPNDSTWERFRYAVLCVRTSAGSYPTVAPTRTRHKPTTAACAVRVVRADDGRVSLWSAAHRRFVRLVAGAEDSWPTAGSESADGTKRPFRSGRALSRLVGAVRAPALRPQTGCAWAVGGFRGLVARGQGTHRVLTGYSQGTHRVLTGYSCAVARRSCRSRRRT